MVVSPVVSLIGAMHLVTTIVAISFLLLTHATVIVLSFPLTDLAFGHLLDFADGYHLQVLSVALLDLLAIEVVLRRDRGRSRPHLVEDPGVAIHRLAMCHRRLGWWHQTLNDLIFADDLLKLLDLGLQRQVGPL